MNLTKLWETISKNCLKGNSVPEPLKALWKEKLEGNAFLEDYPFGEAELIDSYPDDIFHGYSAEFIGSQKDADAWKRMFDEIGFFAMEEDGGLIGLWFYSDTIDSNAAPVIQLDNEGQFEILSQSIRDYPLAKASWETDDKELEDAQTIITEWCIKHDLGEPLDIAQLENKIDTLPNPNERFDEYYDAL